MRKFAIFHRMLVLLIVLSLTVVPVFGLETEEDISVTNGCRSADAKWSMLGSEQLIENCGSAMLYEIQSDTMMYAWNPDVQVHPASLVKIMTALLVIENTSMTDAVTIRQDVLDTVSKNSISANLIADEVMTVEDLMYCMMVASANDAAAVLADHALGSQEAFVDAMNARAEAIGCTATHFVNAHGLHDDEQVSTGRDLVRILQEASKNELFLKFFSAITYDMPQTNKSDARSLVSENYLICKKEMQYYFDSRVTGSRTGTTTARNRNVASIAEKNGLKFICIITDSASYYSPNGYSVLSYGGYPETSDLLNRGFDGFVTAQPLYKDQAIRQVQVSGGESDLVLGVCDDLTAIIASNTDVKTLRFEYSSSVNSLKAPVEKGAIVGNVTLWNGNMCIGSTDLYAMNRVAVNQIAVDDDDSGALAVFGKILLFILALAVAFFAVILCVRWVRIFKITKMKRTHRRSHRRSR